MHYVDINNTSYIQNTETLENHEF